MPEVKAVDGPLPVALDSESDDRREIEAKFAVTKSAAVDDLVRESTLGDDFRLESGRLVRIEDTYYDTLDFALLRGGIVLRVRHLDGEARVTVKGLTRKGFGAIHDRFELEGTVPEPASPLDPDAWPTAIRDMVLSLAGGRPELAPACTLEQDRHLWAVRRADAPEGAAPVGELSVERVTVVDPDRYGVRHGEPKRVARFAESECELMGGGTPVDLAEIASLLGRRDGFSAASGSKFERALALVAGHPPASRVDTDGVQPAMAMPEAGRLIWRQQLAGILLNEAGARLGEDIEYVHDMRVATRRSRAAAAMFGEGFESGAIKPFLKGLRKTGRALGSVRDLDVALEWLAVQRASMGPEEAAGLDALVGRWRDERTAAYEDLLTWLDRDAYRRFLVDFSAFCATPGAGVRKPPDADDLAPTPRQVRHVMPLAILERFAAVRAYETVFERQEPVPAEVLHALRIDCKGLRYSLEFVRHLLGADGKTLIKQLKVLQDHLGELNDAVVARQRLQQLRDETSDNAGVGAYGAALRATIEAQLEVQEATIEALQGSFPAVWEAFIAPDNRRLLMGALAQL